MVKYNSKEIHMETNLHGFHYSDIKHAKNLQSIRDQVIPYLVVCEQIVGSNIIMQLNALGLDNDEIEFLRPKIREITQYLSPYYNTPCSLSLIAFWYSKDSLSRVDLIHLQWKQ